jgi:hypothetical protein
VCSLLEHDSAKSATQMGVGRVIFVCGFAYRPAALSMPRSDVALRNGTGCTGTARLQTEAACQTISTRADLAATFFFAAQATFALILSPYFYQVLWRHRAGADFSRIDARRFAHVLRRANLPTARSPACGRPFYLQSLFAASRNAQGGLGAGRAYAGCTQGAVRPNNPCGSRRFLLFN